MSDRSCMGLAWKSLDIQTTLAFSGVISSSTSRRALPSYSCQPGLTSLTSQKKMNNALVFLYRGQLLSQDLIMS